jgi:L-fuculose-phosphate aldolase
VSSNTNSIQPGWNEKHPKFQIAAARRILFRAGLDSQIGGHISLRIPGADAFYITPFQYFDETLPEDLSIVGFDLAVRESGRYEVSPGINFHSDIYRARTDVHCIVHTHARNAALLSTLASSVGTFHVYSAFFFEDVAFFRDDCDATPDVEGPAIAKGLGDKRAVLMSHHGSINVGATLQQTVAEALLFDIAAQHHLDAVSLGGKPLDDRTIRTYRRAFLNNDFREQLWEANYRRLRRSDPELFSCLRQS